MGHNPDADDLPSAGDRYRVDDLLGEGGMAVVYRGFDHQLQRPVALKFLRSRDTRAVELFQREARAVAAIDHEHVCRVFEVGESAGRGFLAMQLVDGETLQDLAPKLELVDKLRILEQVARAVEAAHREGVVHRDLNPRNVMVEQRPGGGLHAYVMDFGIARLPDGEDAAPATTSPGSPAFRPPEVLLGTGTRSERLVDVYGIGATAYAVLAEQAPYFGADRDETERRVLEGRPLRLGLVVPGVPTAIERIVETAMATEPKRRYRSADAVAEDLRRWRDGRPILAGPIASVARLAPWWRTQKITALAAAMAVFAVVVTATVLLASRQREAVRTALTAGHRAEVEQIDRVLRRARMMPLHDTTAAVREARARMAEVEASLLEHGPIARGPASYALGFGHLMLREFAEAEIWLRAAVDDGYDEPEVRSALGIALAMQLIDPVRDGTAPRVTAERSRIDEAIRMLDARGPGTTDREKMLGSLALAIEDRIDDAIDSGREAARRTPWLYESNEILGDLLVIRGARKASVGDLDGARSDLEQAGAAYSRGLEIGRSDSWLFQAEARRGLRLLEMGLLDEAEAAALIERSIAAAAAAHRARPDRSEPAELRRRLEDLADRRSSRVVESHGAEPR